VAAYGAGMLVGREGEQRLLDGLLRQARAGLSGVVVLRGEPGIGKTALLGYAASRAGAMRVLRATGVEVETGIAFAGLYSLLHPLAGHLVELPGLHEAAVRAVLGLSGEAAAVPDRLAVAAGTLGLLAAAAGPRPLLVLVDDLHWLDPASIEALLFAVRRLDNDAVACVFSTRPGLPGLDGLPTCDLAGLAESEAALLVRAVAGIDAAPEVARRLHAETGGNPLALTEAAVGLTAQQLAGADLPQMPLEPGESVRQRYAVRLAGLDPAVKVTLLVVAAAGTCPAPAVMAAAIQLGGGQALEAAEEARLVRVSGAEVAFCHPLVRSVAYHQAAPSQRRAAHRTLAAVLASSDVERAAWHLAAAATGTDDAAAGALADAARAAERKGAPKVAAAAWERAGELSATPHSRKEYPVRAAEAALRGGDLARAGRLAAAPASALSAPLQGRLFAVQGRVDFLRGQMSAAQAVLRDAAQLAAGHDPRLAAELLAESIEACAQAGLHDQATQSAQLIHRLAARAGEHARFLADLACGQLAMLQGNPAEAIRLLRRCAAWLAHHPAAASSAVLQIDAVAVWMHLGRSDRASLHADRAVQLARDAGELGRLPDALSCASACYCEIGRWQQALAHANQVLELAQATGQPFLACQELGTMTLIEAAQGHDQECRAHARDGDRLAAELGLRLRQLRLRSHLALLEFGQSRFEEAIARYEQIHRLTADWHVAHPWFSPVPDLIEAYVRVGDLRQASALLPEFEALLSGQDNLLEAGRAERLKGVLADNHFDGHFLRGIALHEQCQAVFQQARTHLCYGERLRRARRRRDARVQLRAAIEIFDQLDAAPWAERARAELRAAGESITPRGGISQRLTPQELQIALLVSEGRTNIDIGRAVFLSTRTVEFHLSRAYRKLGVATRTELTRKLASAGFQDATSGPESQAAPTQRRPTVMARRRR
jgi:DNA-binding CsgD family transcriptional regulator